MAILLVACGTKARARSSAAMPEPLSLTATARRPPSSRATSIRVAPASKAFSTKSLTMLAGLDHLARGDLVHQHRRKHVNGWHGEILQERIANSE